MPHLERHSLRMKLVAVTVLSTAATLLLAGAILVVYENFAYRSQKEAQYATEAEILSASVAAPLLFADADAVGEYLEALAANREIAAAAVYDAAGARFAAYAAAAEALPAEAASIAERSAGGDLLVSRPVTVDGQDLGRVVLRARIEAVEDRAVRYGGIILLVMLGSLVVTLPLSLWLAAAIVRPVRRMADAASRVAAGDLTVDLQAKPGADELGLLTGMFSAMLESLRAINREIRDGVEVLGSSVAEIVSSAGQVSTDAGQTVHTVQDTAQAVERARETARAANDDARGVAQVARRAADVSETGRAALEQSIGEIDQARVQMKAIAERVGELREQARSIQEIIAVVGELAEQSNRLAVNAAIEAARAGEHGRGFAVVAREVRGLAEGSKRATVQVGAILKEVEGAVEAAIAAAERGSRSVDASAAECAKADEAIRALARSVREAASAAARITQSSERQLADMERAATAMSEIRGATEQNLAGARHTESAAQSIDQLGKRLGLLVERFQA